MRWDTSDISDALKYYIKRYFRNSIKGEINIEWSRKLYNTQFSKVIDSNGAEAKLITFTDGTHKLILNTSLYNASPELMRNTLVHELIHAWQAEHGYLGDDPHGISFVRWCNKLNATGEFAYPLAPHPTSKENRAYRRTNNSGYYVYKITTEYGNESNKFPVGVFINFLYANECTWLKNKGFKLRYYTCLKPGKTAPLDLRTGDEQFSHYFLTLSFFKKHKLTPDNFVKTVDYEWGDSRLFHDDSFNYEDGVEV